MSDSRHLVLVLMLAAAIDVIFGERSGSMHPVVWIGKLINFLKKCGPKNPSKVSTEF